MFAHLSFFILPLSSKAKVLNDKDITNEPSNYRTHSNSSILLLIFSYTADE